VVAAKVPLTTGLQETVPEYWAVSVIVVTGVAPNDGAVTPGIAAIFTTVSGIGVTGLGHPSKVKAVRIMVIGIRFLIFILVILLNAWIITELSILPSSFQ